MSARHVTLIGFAVAVSTACSGNPPPVALLGGASDIANLVGEWTGEYRSIETGRSGIIYFRLEAGANSAVGDVLLVPADGVGHDHPEGVHPPAEYLPITFVRVLDGMIRGTLDPYRDPECGCRLETTFEGRLRADTISGSYTSRHIEVGRTQTGTWLVTRSSSDDTSRTGPLSHHDRSR